MLSVPGVRGFHDLHKPGRSAPASTRSPRTSSSLKKRTATSAAATSARPLQCTSGARAGSPERRRGGTDADHEKCARDRLRPRVTGSPAQIAHDEGASLRGAGLYSASVARRAPGRADGSEGPQRPEHEHHRRETDDRVHRGDPDLHPDRERQRCGRRRGLLERVDEEHLLGAGTTGSRNERRETACHDDECRERHGGREAERSEQAEGDAGPAGPAGELERGDVRR